MALALPLQEPPVLDGDVLNDPAWAGAPAATDFRQTTPNDGQPASERTEVRIGYTGETLYFGVVCYDRDPAGIVVSDSRRDSSLDEIDSFRIILDTYRDRQNGFVFGTSPAGPEYDGQVINEGEAGSSGGGGGGGNQQGGSGGGFNLNWDGAWQVRTRTSEVGWSAEFAIPFRTLRYASGREQAWGLNFQRNIRRRNENAFWAPLPRQFNLYRVSLAGELRGLQVTPQRNLKLIPYVLGEGRQIDPRLGVTSLGDTGLDAKYSLTPSLTLDATVNTDFAQVEVDDQRVNLDRFNLFFPEKRPFFLENAGLFSVGNPGKTEIFFSRRIGIDSSGEPIPILGGARLTGKVRGFSVGLLDMQTGEDTDRAPGNNFTVARLRRDLPNRSSLGAIFANREATGDGAGDDDRNRTVAVDGRWGVGRNGLISGFVARTATPGLRDDDHAYDLRSQYRSPQWRFSLGYAEVAKNFNPDVGFLTRSAFRAINWEIYRTIRLGPTRGLHEIRPHVNYTGFWNFQGFQETGVLHIDSNWEHKNGNDVDIGANLYREGVTKAFEIFPGVIVPPGIYDHREAQLELHTNEGAPVSVDATVRPGGFYDGHRLTTTLRVKLRTGEAFTTDLDFSRNDVHLPGGSFVTNLVRGRGSYSFTPRIFVQSLIQYNDRADIWSMNLRFGWLQDANTGLFVVWNDTREIGEYAFLTPTTGRSLIIKFSRMFDVLR